MQNKVTQYNVCACTIADGAATEKMWPCEGLPFPCVACEL